jgi:hypothetical protein
MPYRMVGIDVHKKRLAVVVADVEVEDEYQFERRWYGSNPEQLRVLSEWLVEQQVEEVVMESTAQYCAGYCGKSAVLDDALALWAEAYGDQTVLDHAALVNAFKNDRKVQALMGQ